MNVLLPRRAGALVLVLGLGAGVAACGSGSASSDSKAASSGTPRAAASGGGAGAARLALSAKEAGGLSFSKARLHAKAGKVTITLRNPSGDQLPHGIAVEGKGVDKDGPIAQPGGTSRVTVALKPGRYEFYCPVGNHKQAGMEGTLTVS